MLMLSWCRTILYVKAETWTPICSLTFMYWQPALSALLAQSLWLALSTSGGTRCPATWGAPSTAANTATQTGAPVRVHSYHMYYQWLALIDELLLLKDDRKRLQCCVSDCMTLPCHIIDCWLVVTAWEVAGEYIYTTPGDLDSDYMMLSLTVPGYRWDVTRTNENSMICISCI